MNHPPMARGVSHLMYVGDDGAGIDQKMSRAQSALALGSGALALFGDEVGLSKEARKVCGAVAIGTLLVAFLKPV